MRCSGGVAQGEGGQAELVWWRRGSRCDAWASRWPRKVVSTAGRSPEKRTRGGELRCSVASLCEASRGGEWDQERLGEAGWHSSWWRRAKPQQGTSSGGAAGFPAKLEVEDELEDLFVKWKKYRGLSVN